MDYSVIVFLIFLVVIIIIILLFIYFSRKNKKKIAGSPCLTNSDCNKETYCSSTNVCMPLGTCSSSLDCPNLYVCDKNNLCISTLPYPLKRDCTNTCSKNSDCKQGYSCYQGTCYPTICGSDIDCQGSQMCYNNQCLVKKCTTSSSCGQNEACIYGKCIIIKQNCANSSNCSKGLICSKQKCVQCSNSNQCKPGEVCYDGICQSNCKRYSCDRGNVCIDGKYCGPGNQACGSLCTNKSDCYGACNNCVNSYCTVVKGEFGDTCTVDDDCLPGLTCMTLNGKKYCVYPNSNCINNSDCKNLLPYCVFGICSSSQLNMKCTSSCGQGLYCVNSVCSLNKGTYGDTCLQNSDCLNGMSCINGVCIPTQNNNQSFFSLYTKNTR